MALGVAHDDVATGFEARRAGHAQRRAGEVDRQGVDTRATERCDDVLRQLARALEGVTARHFDAGIGRIGGRVQTERAACKIRPEVCGQQLIERRAFGQHDGAHIAQARSASLRAAVLKHHIDVVASDQRIDAHLQRHAGRTGGHPVNRLEAQVDVAAGLGEQADVAH